MIAVTGIGLSTILALHREHSWRYYCQGQRAVDVSVPKSLSAELAPYARACPMTSVGSHRIFNLGLHTLTETLQSAQVMPQDFKSDRVATAISVSKQIISQRLKPEEIFEPHQLGGWLAAYHGWSGLRTNVVAACASGAISILQASRWLGENSCDIVFAGGVESSLQDLYVAGFYQLGVLSQNPRPYDVRRDGFMMAEGASVLALQRSQDVSAQKIIAIFKGGALGSDTYAPTAFYPDGSSIVRVVKRALQNCNLSAQDIDYVHLHGTGTRLNDAAESRAMLQIFSAKMPHFSSSKGAFGHTLGASGALGAALCCLALRDGLVPPTTGFEQNDADCNLSLNSKVQPSQLKTALSLSFGFGGSIAALIFQK